MTNFKALNQAVPPHDYRTALQGALSWLGDRYLLAEPVNRRSDSRVQRVELQNGQPSLKTVQWVQYR
jgi:hypothetical protein